jgi:hypothetical protein
MRFLLGLCLGALTITCSLALDDISKSTSVGNIGMTISNYGVIGHGYNIESQPSCLFKQKSGLEFERVEHFSFGGLWIGGIVNGQHRVSSAIVDGQTSVGEGWEWNNSGDLPDHLKDDPETLNNENDELRQCCPELFWPYEIEELSSLPESDNFSTRAVSHQDFNTSFSDTSTIIPSTGLEITNHTPMGLRVDFKTHAWNFPYADAFVILDLTVHNISKEIDPDGIGWPIDSVYVGYWIDEAVGNMNYTDYYTPGGGWYWYDNLAGILVTDSTTTALGDTINMVVGYDADGDNGNAESFVGLRYLGGIRADELDPNLVNPQAQVWPWNGRTPVDQGMAQLITPINEQERFEKMTKTPSVLPAFFPYTTENQNSWMMLGTAGSFGSLDPATDTAPGDSLNAVFAIVCGSWDRLESQNVAVNPDELQMMSQSLLSSSEWASIAWNGEDKNRNGELDPWEDLDGDGILDRYILPVPPPAPTVHLEIAEHELELYWSNSPESFIDPIEGEPDFEGYRVYSSPFDPDVQVSEIMLGQFDIVNDIWPNTGLDDVRIRNEAGEIDSLIFEDTWFHYVFRIEKPLNITPWNTWLAVTSYDQGVPENNLPSLESAYSQNRTYYFPGNLPPADDQENRPKPSVYPNPYRGQAAWDGQGASERLIWFTNLPAQCEITIFTLSGDLIDTIEHDSATYQGRDVALINNLHLYGDVGEGIVFSGGEHAWDLISRHNQAIATGLYLFTVKNKANGKIDIGKFAVVK